MSTTRAALAQHRVIRHAERRRNKQAQRKYAGSLWALARRVMWREGGRVRDRTPSMGIVRDGGVN